MDRNELLDLLIYQWRGQPNLAALVGIIIDTHASEIEQPRKRLEQMLDIDLAEGVWLDYLGERLGLHRPSIAKSTYEETFGFDLAGVGYDQHRFGDVYGFEEYTPLGDLLYRKLIKARGHYVQAAANLHWLEKSVAEVDASATIADANDMTITITASDADSLALMKLAEKHQCLPIPPGVSATLST